MSTKNERVKPGLQDILTKCIRASPKLTVDPVCESRVFWPLQTSHPGHTKYPPPPPPISPIVLTIFLRFPRSAAVLSFWRTTHGHAMFPLQRQSKVSNQVFEMKPK